MSEILTNNKYYSDIADTIRQMKGVATTYKPREMAGALREMYSTEVEGVPPLTFPSNGNNLLNYRIDGASGGVGDRTKNLLNNTATSQTVSGVTFTVNEDGSVTCNGTATNNIFFSLTGNNSIENIILNGCPAGGSGNSYLLRAIDTNGRVLKTDSGEGTEVFNLINAKIQIRIAKDYICNNLTFYPMIRLATVEDDTYEPYGYKIPVIINGKNLFDGNLLQGYYPDSNMDDLVATTSNYRTLKIYLPSGTYTFSSSVNILIIRFITSTVYQQNPNGNNLVKSYTFQINDNGYISLSFRNESNTAWDNSVDLQIEKGLISTSFETYYEPTTTNIYLDEPIEVNESKSLSDTNVNIPTINGTNILSIDTTVQPSNVYVQAPKTNNYNL